MGDAPGKRDGGLPERARDAETVERLGDRGHRIFRGPLAEQGAGQLQPSIRALEDGAEAAKRLDAAGIVHRSRQLREEAALQAVHGERRLKSGLIREQARRRHPVAGRRDRGLLLQIDAEGSRLEHAAAVEERYLTVDRRLRRRTADPFPTGIEIEVGGPGAALEVAVDVVIAVDLARAVGHELIGKVPQREDGVAAAALTAVGDLHLAAKSLR